MDVPLDAAAETAQAAQAAAPSGAEPAAAAEPRAQADGAAEVLETAAMEAVRAIDPAFASFADLAAMPEAGAFNRLVLKGNTLADAFRLARYEALSARRAAEAGKTALSRAYNRAHLTAAGGGGAAADPVPPGTMEMYRQLCPGLPDEAYRAHYRRARSQ